MRNLVQFATFVILLSKDGNSIQNLKQTREDRRPIYYWWRFNPLTKCKSHAVQTVFRYD